MENLSLCVCFSVVKFCDIRDSVIKIMKQLLIASVKILFFFQTCFSNVFICRSIKNCFCPEENQATYLCPINYVEIGGFQVAVTPLKQISIDCEKLSIFDPNQLPKINISEVNSVKIRFCPLPHDGFKKVLEALGVEKAVVIEFEFGDLKNGSLTKKHLEGLEDQKFFKLSRNDLGHLEKEVFLNTPNLLALDLSSNGLTELAPSLFEKTTLLEWLDLENNKLEKLPFGIFDNLENLEYLGLWNNNLKVLFEHTFNGLVSLKTLILSANKIEHVSENVFQNLKNLVNVSLAMNNLTSIPPNLFKHNSKIQSIFLDNNLNLTLPESLFVNLFQLKQVDLSDCNLKNIPRDIFQNNGELKILLLGGNFLKHLSKDFFKNIPYLEKLDLSVNQIEVIADTFTFLRKLKVLELQNNLIQVVPEETFISLNRLEEINLQQNQITTIHAKAFSSNDYLRVINLSYNQYSRSKEVLLKNSINIEDVNLSHNLISNIEDVITIENKAFLHKLDLSYNLITEVTVVTLQSGSDLEVDLDHNNISVVNFNDVDLVSTTSTTTIYLGSNPLKCNCHNYDLAKYLQSKNMAEIDIKVEQSECGDMVMVPLSDFTCKFDELTQNHRGCPKECLCMWNPFDTSIIINCNNRNLIRFPRLVPKDFNWINFSQIEVHLENNNLEIMESITGYENVTKLFVSFNVLKALEWVPPKVKVLHIDNNRLSYLNFTILQALNATDLTQLTLHNNPWICKCNIVNFTTFIRQRAKQIDSRRIFCNNTTTRLIHLTKSYLCQDLTLFYICLLITLTLPFAISTSVYFAYQQKIKFWLFSKNLCLCWVSEDDLDEDKTYDAFVSYSHKDEDFVSGTLVPKLEKIRNYKLCLHYRDWVPGEFISSQVISSIEDSRRTIVVLSKNFLESVWGKAEFRQAHSAAMRDGRVRVIMILYGEVESEKLDEEMEMYLQSNTYLKWGDQFFWKKLEYALPHKKIKV